VLESAIRRAGLSDRVEVIATSCRDRCEYGPSMNVYPGPVFYAGVTEEAIEEIVAQHLAGGQAVERYRYKDPARAFRR
jgi:NADH-quinone oxidoreductase subunit F